MVLLQALLGLRDIFRAVGDFRPLAIYLSASRRGEFERLFQQEEVCYYPLFAERLLYGFLNAELPHRNLVAVATERACRRHRPRVTLSFLEHFPYSRAHYEGVRRSQIGARCCAVQHASYNREKTFLFLDPSLEWRGEPEGCVVPHPDYVLPSGELGTELFLQCGYPLHRVLTAASPRHLGTRASPPGACAGPCGAPRTMETVRVLLVCTLNVELELDMVEAVYAAAQGSPAITLLLRNHPARRVDQQPAFLPYKKYIAVTRGSLEDDLAAADLVLFTYSTVAEEAFLQGKPVWQWLPAGFDGSALAETVRIPRFGSVASLRRALAEFRRDPARFAPDEEMRRHVLERLFCAPDAALQPLAPLIGRLVAEASVT
ncbi:MAG: hypothetical protein HY238_03850 [Acidobacteria bacterium]|nr:hypothetical protein [Acidobacteriota bacterium]